MSQIAFIFPGQGSQYVGMGQDFYSRTLKPGSCSTWPRKPPVCP